MKRTENIVLLGFVLLSANAMSYGMASGSDKLTLFDFDKASGILGIEPGASEQVIKTAYKAKALEMHPDRNPTNPFATARFQELGRAHELFLEPQYQEARMQWQAYRARHTQGRTKAVQQVPQYTRSEQYDSRIYPKRSERRDQQEAEWLANQQRQKAERLAKQNWQTYLAGLAAEQAYTERQPQRRTQPVQQVPQTQQYGPRQYQYVWVEAPQRQVQRRMQGYSAQKEQERKQRKQNK